MDLSFVSLALSGASALRGHFINTAHVLSTTSSEANNYALPWQQCGGKHYKGHTKCTPGHLCKHLNDWWSQCVPDPSLKGPPTYSQCGGKGFEGETTCRDGDMCVVLSKYYSQCVPMVMPPQYKQKCTNVNVLGDATYCIKGPVCGSEDEEGHKCPKKGDIAVGNCLSQLKSYVAFAKCVAPKDATCQKTEFGESVCSFSKIHIKTTKTTVTEAPATEATGDKNSTATVIDAPVVVNITVRGNETIPVIAVTPLIVGNGTFGNATDDEVVTTSVPPVTVISVNTTATNKTNKTAEVGTVAPPTTTIAAVNATRDTGDVIIVPTNITAAPVKDVIVSPVVNDSPVLNVTAGPAQVVVVPSNVTQVPTTESIVFPVNASNETDVILAPATPAATTLAVNATGANATETGDTIVFPTLI